MKVTVDPQRPIPGILLKNKLITEKVSLDLNRNEILRCMQYGTVYDEYGNAIDIRSLNKLELHNHIRNITGIAGTTISAGKTKICNTTEIVGEKYTTNIKEFNINGINSSNEDNKPAFKKIEEPMHIDLVPVKSDISKPDFCLDVISCKKEDKYIEIILKLKALKDIKSKDGNLYGLFTIIGKRPSILEYKLDNDNWIKFNNKFNSFNTINDGDEFIFRLIPKDNSNIKFKVNIKESNCIIAEVESEINITDLYKK